MSQNGNCPEPLDFVSKILDITKEVNVFQDVDAILDKLLYEARRLSKADAGTIYLVEQDRLRFSYVHNDTLLTNQQSNTHKYLNLTIPLDTSSIVGYAAVTGQPVSIDDAYGIPPAYPFTFNPAFDEKYGYRTGSILALPLHAAASKLVGVMQLINAKDELGEVAPFSDAASTYLPLLASNAAAAIERGQMTRELVLRMMRMAELHDPKETGAHVLRVGAYSAEIYTRWARKNDVPDQERRRFRDLLRLTSMLHDVGKVGISDTILKKPGRLESDEFKVMQLHTVYGARLFSNRTSVMDGMAADIALNHHERWDGSGYPGVIEDIHAEKLCMGPVKARDEIPLAARIVSVADVYDALSSKRSYKEGWPEDQVLEHIRKQAGSQFDPNIVDAFLDIHDVIKAIKERFSDDGSRIEGLLASGDLPPEHEDHDEHEQAR